MRQRMTPAFWHIGAVAALALLVTLRPGAALAKDHPQLSLSPSKGGANTQITITGKSFPAFCVGTISIDDNLAGAVYNCGSDGAFQTHLTWPDGLDDGKHTITARGFSSSAQATFTQVTGTPTPDATATAAAGATVSAGQATAAAQSTATASAPTATKSGAVGAGGATPPSGGAGISPAALTMILVASLLLIAGGVLLALALSNRRQVQHGLPTKAYRPAPPPPPNVTLPQGEDWVWPNDPYRR